MRYWFGDGPELATNGNPSEQVEEVRDLEDDQVSEADFQANEDV